MSADYINMSCVSCGKDIKRYRKSFPKASEGVFTTAYHI